MIYGKTNFNALRRVSQERVDAIVKEQAKAKASELDTATAIMRDGYRVEFHWLGDEHATLEWQADVHPPMGS